MRTRTQTMQRAGISRAKNSERTFPIGGWTPRLRGHIYCSPCCGAGCTKAAYDRAWRNAEALVKRMKTPGWKPHVWENCAWHYAIKRPFMKLYVTASKSDGKIQYHLLVDKRPDALGGCGEWNSNNAYSTDPNEAVRMGLELVKRFFDETAKLREIMEAEIGAL